MYLEWDEAKNERNIRERGIDFADAEPIVDAPMFRWRRPVALDSRKANARETKRYIEKVDG